MDTNRFADAWAGFKGRLWKEEVNTRDFIQNNYKPYDGDESFLAEPTEATNKLWGRLQELQAEERAKGGVLDMETRFLCKFAKRIKTKHQKGTTSNTLEL